MIAAAHHVEIQQPVIVVIDPGAARPGGFQHRTEVVLAEGVPEIDASLSVTSSKVTSDEAGGALGAGLWALITRVFSPLRHRDTEKNRRRLKGFIGFVLRANFIFTPCFLCASVPQW